MAGVGDEGRKESVHTHMSSSVGLPQGHIGLDQQLPLRVQCSHTNVAPCAPSPAGPAAFPTACCLRGSQELCAPSLKQLHEVGEARLIPGSTLGNRVTLPPAGRGGPILPVEPGRLEFESDFGSLGR